MKNKSLSPAELKAHLLSKGILFDLSLFEDIQREFYENQFVYNQTSRGIKKTHRIPQALLLEQRVISAILRRENSPWNLRKNGENLELYYKDEFEASLDLPEKPAYFGRRLSDGSLSQNVIAVAGEQTPGFFFYPDCFYFKKGKQCKFCSVKGTRKTVGKDMVLDFTQQQVTEATQLFQNMPWRNIPIISITTGTFPSGDLGAEYTSRMVRWVYDALDPKIPIHLLTMPPENLDLIKKYRDAGVTSLAFNLEVFNPVVFRDICPGKEEYYGYERFLKSFDYARKVFGDYNIFCGFVWGLEPMESTVRGYQYFLDRGVSISSNVFHSDARSVFANRQHPSVETILNLCIQQSRLYERYPQARTIFPVSMRSTLDYEIHRGDFRQFWKSRRAFC